MGIRHELSADNLRDLISETAARREASWNGEGYSLSIKESAILSCRERDWSEDFAELAAMSLTGSWNNALHWANK